MELIFIAIAAVAGLYFILNILNGRKFAGLKLPPVEKGLIPYVGVGINFATGPPLAYTRKLYEKHGEVFTMQLFGKRLTFLVGSEAHQPFFMRNDRQVSQDDPYRFSVPIFGPGVVYDAEPSVRIQQLRFISKSLKGDMLRTYVPLIVKEVEDYFHSRWDSEGEVDLRDALSEVIILTASRCLMGEEIRETLHERVAQLYQDLDEGLTPISVFFPYAPLPAHRKRDRARLEMVKLFGKVMQERRSNPDVQHNDVLQVFMEARYKDDRPLTEEEVAGLMIALLFAGQHTSSVTSSWTGLLVLAHKAKLYAPLCEEIAAACQQDGGISFDALKKMDLLHACTKEALRMYPPLIFLMRQVVEPFRYKDYDIPKDDVLFVSTALSMRLGSGKTDLGAGTGCFSNPDEYDPYRFLAPREEDKSADFGFIGFGGGAHGCLGESFAYVQIKTIWATLLRDYELELVGKLPEPDYNSMVVGPKHPCKIRYKKVPSKW